MTLPEVKELVKFMRAEGVVVFEHAGLKVQFLPRALQPTDVPGAEATQPATPSKSSPEQFQGMDVATLLGRRDDHVP